MNGPNAAEGLDRAALRRVLADAAARAGGQEATAWLLDASGDLIIAIGNHGPTASLIEGERIPARGSVVGFVALSGIPMAIGPDEAQHPHIMARTGTIVSAMVVVPLRYDDEVIGALSVVNPVAGGLFGSESMHALAGFAQPVAELLYRHVS